jgi:hypothetical protein
VTSREGFFFFPSFGQRELTKLKTSLDLGAADWGLNQSAA